MLWGSIISEIAYFFNNLWCYYFNKEVGLLLVLIASAWMFNFVILMAAEKKVSKVKRIDPWGANDADISDYEKLMREFGIEPFSNVIKDVPAVHKYMRRGIIYGHRDFRRIAQAMKNKKPFIMLTGLMPSGKMHLGHKMVADEMVYFQQMGAHCYVCVADVEAYLTRGMDPAEMKELAVNEYLLNYIALGLKPEMCTFYFQSDFSNDYNVLSKYFSKKVTFNELKAIYGDITTGKIVSALTQVADILYPQIDMGKPTPTVVPVGTDQDPHLRLTRDIAARFKKEYNFILPSSTYHRYQKGLSGSKMSSSDPNTYIALTDTKKDVEKKIKRALTGGRDTLDEQKRLGGQPNICTIFDLYKFHLVDDDEELKVIYDECVKGEVLCGECKNRCIDYAVKFLGEHQKKREMAKGQLHKFLK